MRFIFDFACNTVRDYFYVRKFISGMRRARAGLYRTAYADGALIAQSSIRAHSSVERTEVFSAIS